eukprot:TRINITY_DN20558_c1_g1_i1.p2 TRINITY_DN20558_c1_g1~~TRINITY_DN20558_c1_g1_i1.p2  ORF type:complete len:203 (+),score=-21.27 TRINITY_DN20558_c1_g1_i1:370-978(+)
MYNIILDRNKISHIHPHKNQTKYRQSHNIGLMQALEVCAFACALRNYADRSNIRICECFWLIGKKSPPVETNHSQQTIRYPIRRNQPPLNFMATKYPRFYYNNYSTFSTTKFYYYHNLLTIIYVQGIQLLLLLAHQLNTIKQTIICLSQRHIQNKFLTHTMSYVTTVNMVKNQIQMRNHYIKQHNKIKLQNLLNQNQHKHNL